MISKDYIRVLYIDLENEKISVDSRRDLISYLGGVGIASKLLEENIKAGKEPLDPGQPIVFAIGAATAVFPVITKTVAMFVSPLTGELGESYAGGRMALALLHAGYDAVVITGKARRPVYLAIQQNNVEFRDARPLWGLGVEETGRIIREREPGGGKRSIIRIGPAGENGVRFASVCVDTYRHFGRLGLGCAMGSKNLKAISMIGLRSMPVKNFKDYYKAYRDIFKKCTDTDMMQKYHDAGTPINIRSLSAGGALPTRNLASGTFEKAEDISGEAFAKDYLARKMACTGCPVGCIHIGEFRRKFAEGHEYEIISASYDYELLFALGSFLGVDSPHGVLTLIDRVEELGLDAMSTGVALGWATEAFEKKLINETHTLVPLEWGNFENYAKAIGHLSAMSNAFYSELAKGVKHASSVYGGRDFAMHIAGNEMPGYHTGYGALVGAAIGARHSHLCNGGYSADQSMTEYDSEKMADKIYQEEVERCMTNCLIMCLFARKVYDKETIMTALKALGYNYNLEELDKLGERVLACKLRIKDKLGFEMTRVELPKRFFETPSMRGSLEEKEALKLIKTVWDRERLLIAKYAEG
jgi:aldehyde:ferredoxin oxidoreductase